MFFKARCAAPFVLDENPFQNLTSINGLQTVCRMTADAMQMDRYDGSPSLELNEKKLCMTHMRLAILSAYIYIYIYIYI